VERKGEKRASANNKAKFRSKKKKQFKTNMTFFTAGQSGKGGRGFYLVVCSWHVRTEIKKLLSQRLLFRVIVIIYVCIRVCLSMVVCQHQQAA
jgi:hypothetical protein